jgi:hypothetical protein
MRSNLLTELGLAAAPAEQRQKAHDEFSDRAFHRTSGTS